MNKKDLKKLMHGFNNISSRMMRVSYDEYNVVLEKFLKYIEEHDIISDYLETGNKVDFDAANEYESVAKSCGKLTFSFGPSEEEESFQIYKVLRYVLDNNKIVYRSMMMQYGTKLNAQEVTKEFNSRIVLVLINNINDYLTGVGIDMGLDDSIVFNVSGGQVNVANDNATVNAIQNNGLNLDEVEKLVKGIVDNTDGLDDSNTEVLVETVEMIKEELARPQPKKSVIGAGIKLIAPIVTIANGIPTLATNIQAFIDYIMPYIQ